MSYELLSSKLIYSGKVFDIRSDLVRLPRGSTHLFDIVDHRPAVTMIPLDGDRRICFIRQYRLPAGKELIELPAGVLEVNEEPMAGAQREIREEIGMSARNLKLIGEFFLAPGYSTERMYVFLADNLTPDPLPKDEDEIISLERISITEAYRMVRLNQIEDAKSISALLLALPYFIKSEGITISSLG
jgi:ADP-ribose pyrophosphatase